MPKDYFFLLSKTKKILQAVSIFILGMLTTTVIYWFLLRDFENHANIKKACLDMVGSGSFMSDWSLGIEFICWPLLIILVIAWFIIWLIIERKKTHNDQKN